MRFVVLGPVAALDDAGPLALGPPKRRLLLSVLLCSAGRAVPVDTLVEALWDGSAPPSAVENVYLHVSQLRKALGAGVIVGRGRTGYTLVAGAGEIDLAVFDALAQEGFQALSAEDPVTASRKLREALALWRGTAFGDLAEEPCLREEAHRLEELRLAVLGKRIEADLALGLHEELTAELVAINRAHPYRELFVAQLMLTLHRSRRQAEALAVYQATRRLFVDDLGIEPGPALQQLHQAILRGDELAPEPRASFAQTPHELPTVVYGFVGRARALAVLDGWLPEDSAGAGEAVVIAIITGTAGVGKTALAVHWAHRVAQRFPGGQLYVDLRGYSSGSPVRPIEALAALLRSLGLPPDQVPGNVTEAAARFRSLVAGRRMLFVLDNAATAEQVRPLLSGSPTSVVVITSRDGLSGLVAHEGAHRITLDVLSASESVDLLGHVIGPHRVAADPKATAKVAHLCSDLPLALRIAAAHLAVRPQLTIAEYSAELEAGDPVTALTIDKDPDHAVRMAFDLSYQRLPEPARRVFRCLGLVACPDFSPAAVSALTGLAEPDVRPILNTLSGAHLVNEHQPRRYTLHDLLRRYAHNLARAQDSIAERAAAAGRLLSWYLGGANAAATSLYFEIVRLPITVDFVPGFDRPSDALDWLNHERRNLVAMVHHTLHHGPRSAVWLLADALRPYFDQQRHLADWITVSRAGLAAARVAGDAQALAASFHCLAHAHYGFGRYQLSISYLEKTIALSRKAGYLELEATALGNLGIVLHLVGRVAEAAPHLSRAQELYGRLGSPQGQARLLEILANSDQVCGRLSQAVDHATRALLLFRENGATRSEAQAMSTLGECHYLLGELAAAEGHLTNALGVLRSLGCDNSEASALRLLTRVHLAMGRLDQAHTCAQDAVAISVRLGAPRERAEVLNALATVLDATGEHDRAIAQYGTAARLASEVNAHQVRGDALVGLARAYGRRGEHSVAVGHAERALQLAQDAQYSILEGQALTVLADLQYRQGDVDKAAQYGYAALRNHEHTGHRLGLAHTHDILGRILRGADQMTAREHTRTAARLYAEIGAAPPVETVPRSSELS